MFKKLLALLLLSLLSSSAFAMSCAVKSLDTAFDDSQAVFLGRVKSVTYLETASIPYPGENTKPFPRNDKSSWCGDKKAVLEIVQSWKGPSKGEITLWSGDGCLGLGGAFEKDKTYLVYALRKKDRFVTSFCDRTMEATADIVKNDKAVLDKKTAAKR